MKKKKIVKKAMGRPRRAPTKGTPINVSVSRPERAAIDAMAKRFAEGNMSQWVREAAVNYRPKKG